MHGQVKRHDQHRLDTVQALRPLRREELAGGHYLVASRLSHRKMHMELLGPLCTALQGHDVLDLCRASRQLISSEPGCGWSAHPTVHGRSILARMEGLYLAARHCALQLLSLLLPADRRVSPVARNKEEGPR